MLLTVRNLIEYSNSKYFKDIKIEKKIKNMPIQSLLLHKLGLIWCCFFQINDFESVYNYARKAYEIDNYNLDAIITLGKIELLRHNYDKALQYANLAVEIDSDNFKAIRLLSKCYIAQGEDESEILNVLNKARTSGNDDELDYDIIKFIYINGNYYECLKECKKSIVENSDSYIAQKAEKYVSKIYEKVMKSRARMNQELELSDEIDGNDELNSKEEFRINESKVKSSIDDIMDMGFKNEDLEKPKEDKDIKNEEALEKTTDKNKKIKDNKKSVSNRGKFETEENNRTNR